MPEISVFDNKTGEIKFTRDLDNMLIEFEKQVALRRNDYCAKYKVETKFIKIPKWFYDPLVISKNIFGWSNTGNYGVYNGLTLCPTESVDDISDIEVF